MNGSKVPEGSTSFRALLASRLDLTFFTVFPAELAKPLHAKAPPKEVTKGFLLTKSSELLKGCPCLAFCSCLAEYK